MNLVMVCMSVFLYHHIPSVYLDQNVRSRAEEIWQKYQIFDAGMSVLVGIVGPNKGVLPSGILEQVDPITLPLIKKGICFIIILTSALNICPFIHLYLPSVIQAFKKLFNPLPNRHTVLARATKVAQIM